MPEVNLINVGLTVVGLVIANYGVKFGRAYPLVKKAFELIKNQEAARKDGKITKDEKIKLYDDIEALIKEAYSIIKGLFPNKSK